MIIEKAPAKINLTLEVLRKRSDGFHEIKSVLQTINLYDTLTLEPADTVVFECDQAEWSAEKSLLSKTVQLLQKATGCIKGASINVAKSIPMMAGLGGDSSDAAAMLRGLNKLWELGLSKEQLQELAAQLGSDVAFFVKGGTALAEGRGEIISPLPKLPEMWLVLLVPEISIEPGKTGRMYSSLKPENFTGGKITNRLIDALNSRNKIDDAFLFNTFESIASGKYPQLNDYSLQIIRILRRPNVHLAGSGPTIFSLFDNKIHAERVYTMLQGKGMRVFLAETL
jgi:4-diphosphocytidyl-2-C-methyl-D-erythritol kinase